MICLRFVPDASGLYSAFSGLFSPYALFLHPQNLLAGYFLADPVLFLSDSFFFNPLRCF
jgi:hypothetical protein